VDGDLGVGMKKAFAILVLVVGLLVGGAGAAHANTQGHMALNHTDFNSNGVSHSCVGAAVVVDDPNIIPGPGSATGLAVYLPAVQSTRPSPIGFGELPPNPCDSTPRG
jgi:hypothetical protein